MYPWKDPHRAYALQQRSPLRQPGVLTAIRIIVGGGVAGWMLLLGALVLGSSLSDNALAAFLNSYALAIASGDWVKVLLVPVAAFALTVTMGRGHAIDRILFTALAVYWLYFLTFDLELTIPVARLMVIVCMILAWSAPMNRWIRTVHDYEQLLAEGADPRNLAIRYGLVPRRPDGPAQRTMTNPPSWPPPSGSPRP